MVLPIVALGVGFVGGYVIGKYNDEREARNQPRAVQFSPVERKALINAGENLRK
jgi:hypothetical protein